MTVPHESKIVEQSADKALRALRKKMDAYGVRGTASLPLYLAYVLSEVRHGGYSTVWPPTWLRAWERLHGRLPSNCELQDSIRAMQVIEWIQSLEGDLRPYLASAKELEKLGRLDKRLAPFAASLTETYAHTVQRRLRAIAARADELPEKKSKYFGTIGTRDEFDLTVLRIEQLSSIWSGVLVFFRDSSGNVAKWFTSRIPQGLSSGLTVRVRATVKAHREHGGVQQTILSRIKVHGQALPSATLRPACHFDDDNGPVSGNVEW